MVSGRVTARLIELTVTAVESVLALRQPADAALSQFFRDRRSLGRRDREFVAETVYAVLRRRRTLEHGISGSVTARRLVLAALTRVGGIGVRQLSDLIGQDDAKWLVANKGEASAETTPAERADLPDWLYQRLRERLTDDEVQQLARGLNRSAPLDLRANPLKASREELIDALRGEGIESSPGRYSPLAIRLAAKLALQRHPLYLSGALEVQDEGSQLLAYLVQPKRGEMVVDFCAGAGGKTLLLGALMRSAGRLYAFDVAEKRLARLRARVARAGLSNVHPVCIARENDVRIKRLAGKIDRVLVDVPCSGLGTLRRNPDLKWRQSPESVTELVRKQHDILGRAARLLKPGGRLVYATCSILPEENEHIVEKFLADHGDFTRLSAGEILARQGIALDTGEDLRLLPHEHDTDGFYAAVLERRR
jgi:16S rRNA (cytosine967-C5)-methyltransferase